MKKNSLLSSILNKIQHVSIAMALLDAAIIAGSYFQQCFSKRERKDTCGIGKRYCREGSDY